MCTLSWLPRARRYAACFNRDERRTRAPASPPSLQHRGGIRFIAPLDGEAGGTWVLVNEFGLSLGLLNRYHGGRPAQGARSRGLLLLDFASLPTAKAVQRSLDGLDLSIYAPFTIAAIEPSRPARLAIWDGERLSWAEHPHPGLVLTSSAVDETQVRAEREAVFRQAEPRTADALLGVHRSHDPRRGPASVCMHRADAETRSCSLIEVDAATVRFVHLPDSPCRARALPELTLARRAPSAAPAGDITSH